MHHFLQTGMSILRFLLTIIRKYNKVLIENFCMHTAGEFVAKSQSLLLNLLQNISVLCIREIEGYFCDRFAFFCLMIEQIDV